MSLNVHIAIYKYIHITVTLQFIKTLSSLEMLSATVVEELEPVHDGKVSEQYSSMQCPVKSPMKINVQCPIHTCIST